VHKRKIQLIAGATYSVSLPKEWVQKNKLKEKEEILLYERNDRTLVLSPYSIKESKPNEISLNVDEYAHTIDQILFAIYYLGIENITLFSKKELSKEVKAKIRKTLSNMSGTEIIREDQQKIIIKVLIDKSKLDIFQIIYRIGLILDLSLSNIISQFNLSEIKMNETEIDRLYHLIAKIVSLSLIDSNILHSSNIKNISFIPSYFLIGKRLENIADNINNLSEYVFDKKINLEHSEILQMIRTELNRTMTYFIQIPGCVDIFKKMNEQNSHKMRILLSAIKDTTIRNYLGDITRFTLDVQEEMINISFYNQLIQNKIL